LAGRDDKYKIDMFGKELIPNRMVLYVGGQAPMKSGKFGIYTPYDTVMTYNSINVQKFLTQDTRYYDLVEHKFSYINNAVYQYEKMDDTELTVYNKFMSFYQLRLDAIDYYQKNKRKLKPGTVIGHRFDSNYAYLVIGYVKGMIDTCYGHLDGYWVTLRLKLFTSYYSLSDLLDTTIDNSDKVFSNSTDYDINNQGTPMSSMYYIGQMNVSSVYDENTHIFSYVNSGKNQRSWRVK
jgi:hypothetical protein